MAFSFDEIFAYGGQLIVAAKKVVPKALGVGADKVDHTAYIQGNTQIGNDGDFSDANATLMVGRESTIGTPRAIRTKGNQRIRGDGGTANGLRVSGGSSIDTVHIVGDMYVTGVWIVVTKGDLLLDLLQQMLHQNHLILNTQVKKDGDLDMLVLKVPEVGVYHRGRVRNEKIIKLQIIGKILLMLRVSQFNYNRLVLIKM